VEEDDEKYQTSGCSSSVKSVEATLNAMRFKLYAMRFR
jgi:hypothetical protein